MLTGIGICGKIVDAAELDGHVILSSEKSVSVTPYVSDYIANITINGIYAIEEEPLNIVLNTGVNKVNLTVSNNSLSETYNFYIVYLLILNFLKLLKILKFKFLKVYSILIKYIKK